MILVDTSGFLAAQAPDQRHHEACAAILRDAAGPFVLSPFVVAELDYLVGKLLGVDGELRLLTEVVRKAYLHAPFQERDLEQARQLIDRYRELGIGLADASLVVLSRRYSTLCRVSRHASRVRAKAISLPDLLMHFTIYEAADSEDAAKQRIDHEISQLRESRS